MTAILIQESRKLVRSSVILVAVFAVFSAMYFAMFPEFADDAQALEEAFPEAMMEFLGIEAIHTIEGFIAAEIYSFFWVLLVGVYFAYVTAGTVAGDVETRAIDLTLSTPVSRESVLVQKVAALWVPLVALNLGVPFIVYAGAQLIDEAFDPVALAMAHLLSIPYLLVCAGIGLVISVSVDSKRTARGLALVLVFLLYLVEGASNMDEDYEWLGALTPNRYYSETDILVHEEFAFFDAAILLGAFLVLFLLAVALFRRRDI